MLQLFIIINDYFNHGLEVVWVEELVIEFSVNYIQIKSGSFHNINAINKVSRWPLLQLIELLLDLSDFFIHGFDIFCQKFNVVFTVFESFELQIYEFLHINRSISINIHFHEDGF